MSINGQIDKEMWYIYIMNYYSTIKKKATGMKLEFVTLSEINQAQKDKYLMFSLICRC